MVQRQTSKPKRTSMNVSLPPPDLATKLQHEADSRMLATSLLVERAVAAYLPTLPSMTNGDQPAP